MNEDRADFPERDPALGRMLADVERRRDRSEEDWVVLESRVAAAAELPLARLRRRSWLAPVTGRARPLVAAASILLLLVLSAVVYVTPRPVTSVADVTAELIELLGEEEVRSFFPGADDPDRLLAAALAAQ